MKIVVIGGTGLIGSKTVAMKLSSTLNEAWARNAANMSSLNPMPNKSLDASGGSVFRN